MRLAGIGSPMTVTRGKGTCDPSHSLRAHDLEECTAMTRDEPHRQEKVTHV
jgi:hypothetical protein